MWRTFVKSLALPFRSLSKLVVPAHPFNERARQKRCDRSYRDVDALLRGLLRNVASGSPVRVGPGSEFHARWAPARDRLRRDFSYRARSNFDRAIGYDLTRPGVLAIRLDKLQAKVKSAMDALAREASPVPSRDRSRVTASGPPTPERVARLRADMRRRRG